MTNCSCATGGHGGGRGTPRGCRMTHTDLAFSGQLGSRRAGTPENRKPKIRHPVALSPCRSTVLRPPAQGGWRVGPWRSKQVFPRGGGDPAVRLSGCACEVPGHVLVTETDDGCEKLGD